MLDFGAAVENRAATAKSPEKGGKGGKRYNHGLDVPHEHRMPPGWQGM